LPCRERRLRNSRGCGGMRVLSSTPTTQATKGGRGGGSAANFRAHVPFGAATLQWCWKLVALAPYCLGFMVVFVGTLVNPWGAYESNSDYGGDAVDAELHTNFH
jgi:hypothetical protein